MARDSSGAYVLPSSNPVVTLTTIASSWANSTLADIASELTNSLDRQGRGAMLASLKLAAGSALAPSVAWDAETNSGWYRAAAADFRLVVGGNLVGGFSALGLLQADSSGNLYRVGFREIPTVQLSGVQTITSAHAGKMLVHPSADTTARIWTVQADATSVYRDGTAITIWNKNAAGTLTITPTDTMRLLGTGATGNRTLTANSIATMVWDDASGEWGISGSGLT